MSESIKESIKSIIAIELKFLELKKINKEILKYNKLKCKLATQQDVVHTLMKQYRDKFDKNLKEEGV